MNQKGITKMRLKSSQMETIQTEFELLQPGDLFRIINNNEPYENSIFMKIDICQDESKRLMETQILGRSIKTIAKNLILNIKTGNIEEYEPHKNDIIMQVIAGYLNINV
jgi:hypothetical protein